MIPIATLQVTPRVGWLVFLGNLLNLGHYEHIKQVQVDKMLVFGVTLLLSVPYGLYKSHFETTNTERYVCVEVYGSNPNQYKSTLGKGVLFQQ